MIIDRPYVLEEIQRHVLIIATEHDFMRDQLTYTGMCPIFRQLEWGEQIPTYTVTCTDADRIEFQEEVG